MRWQDVIQSLQVGLGRLPKVSRRWRRCARDRLLLSAHGLGSLGAEEMLGRGQKASLAALSLRFVAHRQTEKPQLMHLETYKFSARERGHTEAKPPRCCAIT